MILFSLLALAGPPAAAPSSPFQLVESPPRETTLDHPGIPNAAAVWLDMVSHAQKTLDFEEFYASDKPGEALAPIVAAVEKAADKGVVVRFVMDAGYAKKYPETLDALAKHKNVTIRSLDMGALAGGIQHSKYFIVDGKDAYLGSQNFDWRSLSEIQEMGVRFQDPSLIATLQDVYETDWALAGGAPKDTRVHKATGTFPVSIGSGADAVQVTPVYSPAGWLPDPSLEELPRIVDLLDHASATIHLQVLTYKTVEKGEYFSALDDAIRRAAARGVKVELMVSNWGQRQGSIEALKSLEVLQNVDVKIITIPQSKEGFIPFARVAHAKYLVIDGKSAWIGTSNWSKDYFMQTRGVGLIVSGTSFAGALDQVFQDGWSSAYAAEVDPSKTYEPPRVSD